MCFPYTRPSFDGPEMAARLQRSCLQRSRHSGTREGQARSIVRKMSPRRGIFPVDRGWRHQHQAFRRVRRTRAARSLAISRVCRARALQSAVPSDSVSPARRSEGDQSCRGFLLSTAPPTATPRKWHGRWQKRSAAKGPGSSCMAPDWWTAHQMTTTASSLRHRSAVARTRKRSGAGCARTERC